MSEEYTQTYIFVHSGITVRVEGKEKTIFSYSKNYERFGWKNLTGAYNGALMAIEDDLEENFISKLTALIGR